MTLVVEVSKVHNVVVTVDFFHIYFSFASVMHEWCTYITSTPQSPMLCTYEYNLLSLFGIAHMSTGWG